MCQAISYYDETDKSMWNVASTLAQRVRNFSIASCLILLSNKSMWNAASTLAQRVRDLLIACCLILLTDKSMGNVGSTKIYHKEWLIFF